MVMVHEEYIYRTFLFRQRTDWPDWDRPRALDVTGHNCPLPSSAIGPTPRGLIGTLTTIREIHSERIQPNVGVNTVTGMMHVDSKPDWVFQFRPVWSQMQTATANEREIDALVIDKTGLLFRTTNMVKNRNKESYRKLAVYSITRLNVFFSS